MGITPQAAQDACYASGPPPGTDPCMGITPQAAQDACYASGPPPGTSATGVALTIGDPRCAVGLAPDTRDPGCPNFGTP